MYPNLRWKLRTNEASAIGWRLYYEWMLTRIRWMIYHSYGQKGRVGNMIQQISNEYFSKHSYNRMRIDLRYALSLVESK